MGAGEERGLGVALGRPLAYGGVLGGWLGEVSRHPRRPVVTRAATVRGEDTVTRGVGTRPKVLLRTMVPPTREMAQAVCDAKFGPGMIIWNGSYGKASNSGYNAQWYVGGNPDGAVLR